MSNPALPIETTPQKRLESNVVAYLRSLFCQPGSQTEVFATIDPIQEQLDTTRIRIDCLVEETGEPIAPMNMGMSSTLTFRISSHPTVVPSAEHQEITQRLREGIFNDPPQYVGGQPMLMATRTLLNAVNYVPGALNLRPQSRVHLWDVMNPRESVGPSNDGKLASVLEVTAFYGGWDWESATAYP